MHKTRILPVPDPFPTALASQMAKLLPRSMPAPQLFRSVARNESLFGFMVDSQLIGPTGLLDRRTIPKDLRETVILRTCVATANDYEFNLHVQTISGAMGLSHEQIDDVRKTPANPTLWSARQLTAMALVDALVKTLGISDELFVALQGQFVDDELIELTLLTGLYTSVAMLVGLIRPQFDHYRSDTVFLSKV